MVDSEIQDDDVYDYVIVGAGSAGCVLAARLSEDRGARVCLIEAGPRDTHPLISVPAGVAGLVNHKRLGWGYATTPQAGAGGRSIPLPRGRVLGGCSSVNGMVYFRGHPGDYDEWAELGNVGWGFSDVLPYFVRSEANGAFAGPHHGRDGPMTVSSYRRYNPLVDRFLDAAAELQFQRREDFNGGDPEGFGVRQATIRNGRRVSGVTAYLKPAARRANLTILTDALTDRVLFCNGRARGVEFIRGGQRRRVGAQREVIVCAGAYGSPALLQRSGVGDGQSLRDLGIPVARDLPEVGRNLQDHVVAFTQMKTHDASSYGVSVRAAPRLAWNLIEYLLFRRGLLASNLFEATGFVRTDGDAARPDVQLVFVPAARNTSRLPIPIGHGYGVFSVLLRPKSRGSVRLRAADPATAPLIDLNAFGCEEDLAPLVRGVLLARRLLSASSFRGLGSTEILPGPDAQTDADIAAHVRQTCMTVHHPVGTCRMGADALSVVDPELRVRGVAGLRVADASIMPTIIGGNTAAPVVMIAEKAADLIRRRSPPATVTTNSRLSQGANT